jgi:hypothetical protein
VEPIPAVAAWATLYSGVATLLGRSVLRAGFLVKTGQSQAVSTTQESAGPHAFSRDAILFVALCFLIWRLWPSFATFFVFKKIGD